MTERAHQALKEAADRQGRSISAIIDESLELGGILRFPTAGEIVARARASADLSDEDAMAIAVRETRAHRTANDD
ncbi:MAG: hypothetical protein OXJ90_24535 [Spirochaetaceae bacterium]|nr:hypothetical protein [Spirochaetaceae bacterium]